MTFTLAFDVYGTLIDTRGVLGNLKEIVGSRANVFMETWRAKQLEYSFRRAAMRQHVDFSQCTKDAMEYSALLHNTPLTEEDKMYLLRAYTILPAFPEVKSALEALKLAGHRLFAFSNGSNKAIHTLLSHAKILALFDGMVSVEDVQIFKPSHEVYAYFNKKTNSTKETSFLISGNSFDILGAATYGMHTAWVQRSPQTIFDPWGIQPSVVIKDLTTLNAKLNLF